jgi:hypothetical protein
VAADSPGTPASAVASWVGWRTLVVRLPASEPARPWNWRTACSALRMRAAARAGGDVEREGGGGPSSTGGGSGPSRSRSMNSNDMRMPPLPSVMVWWSFCTMAARPSGSPSITVNSHRGRSVSKGARARSVARARASASTAPGGRVTHRRWWSRSKSGSSCHAGVTGPNPGYHPPPQARHHPAGPPQPSAEALLVRRPVEEADVGEVRRQVRVGLEGPHQRLEVAHPLAARVGSVTHGSTLVPPLAWSVGLVAGSRSSSRRVSRGAFGAQHLVRPGRSSLRCGARAASAPLAGVARMLRTSRTANAADDGDDDGVRPTPGVSGWAGARPARRCGRTRRPGRPRRSRRRRGGSARAPCWWPPRRRRRSRAAGGRGRGR